GSLTFTSIDDAHIFNASPTNNYGSATTLQVDDSPVKHFLLKFDVAGVNSQTVTNAKLCLYNTDGANAGGNFHHVETDSWDEDTVTWSNAPTADTGVLASLGSVSPNTWYEVNLTAHVTGDGTYSPRPSVAEKRSFRVTCRNCRCLRKVKEVIRTRQERGD
ncbi:MAG: DNRLRE domain-containing protein, partial [Chloroflexota bacterium]|nr:DNRLRE domain-containing protein [Chloroflexota bacterium]